MKKKKVSIEMNRFSDNHVHIGNVHPDNFDFPTKMLNLLADMGVTDFNLLAYMPFCNIVQNLNVLYLKHTFKRSKIRAFGTFHETDIYKDIPYEVQLDKLLALGFDGVKFIQMKPDRIKVLGKTIADVSYDAALSKMEKLGIPAIIHSGDPTYFWDINRVRRSQIERGWFYGGEGYMSCGDIYRADFEMLEKHPNLKVVFAHFFFLSEDINEARRVMTRYPNVRLDVTPGWEMYLDFSKNISVWRDFFIEFSDRILFGTDSADEKNCNEGLNRDVKAALSHNNNEFEAFVFYGCPSPIKGLDLPSDVLEKIFYKNYANFVGEETRRVNTELLKREAIKMYNDIKDDPKNKDCSEWLLELLKRL